MNKFSDFDIGDRVFVYFNEPYEKRSNRTAYKREWNHLTHDYDYVAGGVFLYVGKNEMCSAIGSTEQ